MLLANSGIEWATCFKWAEQFASWSQVGDGTTTVVLLAAEFLKACKGFVEEGVHPQVRGLSAAVHTTPFELAAVYCRLAASLFHRDLLLPVSIVAAGFATSTTLFRSPCHLALQGIIRSYRQAAQLAVARVRELAVDIGGKGLEERKQLLEKCAQTSLNSKLVRAAARILPCSPLERGSR